MNLFRLAAGFALAALALAAAPTGAAQEHWVGHQAFPDGSTVTSADWAAAQTNELYPFSAFLVGPTTASWDHAPLPSTGPATLYISIWDLNNRAPGSQVTELLLNGVAQDVTMFEDNVDDNKVRVYAVPVPAPLTAQGSLHVQLGFGDKGPGSNELGLDFARLVFGAAPITDPAIEAEYFLGGAGSQVGTGVAVSPEGVFLSGYVGVPGGVPSEGLMARYGWPLEPAPVFSRIFTGTGSEAFYSVAAAQGSIFTSGASDTGGYINDGIGPRERKGFTVRWNTFDSAVQWQRQTPEPAAAPTVQGEEVLNAIAATQEGPIATVYYAAGRAQGVMGGPPRPFLTKFDGAGNTFWSLVDISGPAPGEGRGVAVLDGFIYLAGYEGTTPYLRKFNSDGIWEWERKGFQSFGLNGRYHAICAHQGFIYAAGTVTDAAGAPKDFLYEKWDSDGNRLWSKSIDFNGAKDQIAGVVGLGGELFLAGSASSAVHGGYDAVLLRADAAIGTLISKTAWGGSLDEEFNGVATDGSKIYAVGDSKSFAQGGNAFGDYDAVLVVFNPGAAPPPPPPSGTTLDFISIHPADLTFQLNDTLFYDARANYSDNTARRMSLGTGLWEEKAALPNPVTDGPAAVEYDGCLYLAGGVEGGFPSRSFRVYDPFNDTWSSLPSMNVPHGHPAVVVLGTKLYVVAGSGANGAVESIYLSAPAQGWTMEPPALNRWHLAGAGINAFAYAVGGLGDTGVVGDLERYDPAQPLLGWSRISTLPTPRYGPAAVEHEGKLYVLGGLDGVAGTDTGALEAYDPATNAWTTLAPMPTRRGFVFAGVVKGILYAAGGHDRNGLPLDVVEAYDFKTNSWLAHPRLPEPRSHGSGGAVNGRLFAISGRTPSGDSSKVLALEPREVTFGSGDPNILSITPQGFAVPLHAGTTFITASSIYGLSAQTPVHVASNNQAPTAMINAPVGPVEAGSPAVFDGSISYDPEGEMLSYEWFWTDIQNGTNISIGSEAILSYVFPLGTHYVTLTVTDKEGVSHSRVSQVTVRDTTKPVFGDVLQRVQLFGAGLIEASGDGHGHLYRFELRADGTAALDLDYVHDSVASPWGLAFHPQGELFVSNHQSDPPVARLLNPGGVPLPSGGLSDPPLGSSMGLAFRGTELFVANHWNGSVSRYKLDDPAAPVYNGEILNVGMPRGIAISPSGELFVTDINRNAVRRYIFDEAGNAFRNGMIQAGGLSNPHNMVFSPWGELFVANINGYSVSRFTFDADGHAVPGEPLYGNELNGPLGLAFSPDGELFVSSYFAPNISRWTFDAGGQATPNGSFQTPGVISQMAFQSSTYDFSKPIKVEQTSADGTRFSVPRPPATDNSDAALDVGDNAPDVFPLGETTVVFWAFDDSGNRAEKSVVVKVEDTTAPNLTAPPDVVLEQAGPEGTAYVLPPALFSDICDSDLTVTHNAPAVFPHGTTTVTFTATDHSGNSVSDVTLVTVLDHTPPAFVDALGGSTELSSTLYVVGLPDNGGEQALYRFQIQPNEEATQDLTLHDPSFDFPTYLAFDAKGDMHVVNRGYAGSAWSIGRWTNPLGTPALAGAITEGLQHPHGAAFRGNELFVTNSAGGNVLRFLIDGSGNATSNGSFDVGGWSHVVAVSPWGELFITQPGVVSRFLVEPGGSVSPNGQLTAPGLNGYDLAFSPAGELFVANQYSQSVSRFTFDDQHAAAYNGEIAGVELGVPTGLAFGPGGELFVSSYYYGLISRFVFDAQGTAVSHGTITTPQGMGDIAFATRQLYQLPPLSLVQTDVDGAPVPLPAVFDAVDPNRTVTPDLLRVPVGTTLVTFTARDEWGNEATATQLITVTPDVPVALDLNLDTNEDVPYSFALSATSASGSPLTFQILSGPSHGTLTSAGAEQVYAPATDFHGSDSFTYQARNAFATSAPAVVTITVAPVNDPPVASAAAFATAEDVALTAAVLASDVDGDPLTYELLATPEHGTLAFAADGTFVYTPSPNFHGIDAFSYRTSDGTAASEAAEVLLTVTSVNDAPVAGADAFTTAEDVPLAGSVLGNDGDVDGDLLQASLVGGPAHGTLTLNLNGTFTYQPAANYNGPDSFTYRASDGAAAALATVSLTVTPVNDTPVAAADAYETTRNRALIVAAPGVLANDADVEGSPLTVAQQTGPAHGTLTLNANGAFTYTPTFGYVGPDAFTYRVSDEALSSVATVTINVLAFNTAPVANPDKWSVKKGQTLDVPPKGVLANDDDTEKDPLTVIWFSLPARGTLTMRPDGSFRYVPAGPAGDVTFTYRASDGRAESNLATVTLTIK